MACGLPTDLVADLTNAQKLLVFRWSHIPVSTSPLLLETKHARHDYNGDFHRNFKSREWPRRLIFPAFYVQKNGGFTYAYGLENGLKSGEFGSKKRNFLCGALSKGLSETLKGRPSLDWQTRNVPFQTE